MRALWIVLRKELIDAFRDRRMVIVAFLVMPLVVPAVLAGIERGRRDASRPQKLEATLELPVIGARARAEPDGLARQPEHRDRRRRRTTPDGAVRAQERDVDSAHRRRDYGERLARERAGARRADLRQLAAAADRHLDRRACAACSRPTPARWARCGSSRAACIRPSAEPLQLAHRDVATPESRFDLAQQLMPYLLLLLALHRRHAARDRRDRGRARAAVARAAARDTRVARCADQRQDPRDRGVYAGRRSLVTLLAYRVAFARACPRGEPRHDARRVGALARQAVRRDPADRAARRDACSLRSRRSRAAIARRRATCRC